MKSYNDTGEIYEVEAKASNLPRIWLGTRADPARINPVQRQKGSREGDLMHPCERATELQNLDRLSRN